MPIYEYQCPVCGSIQEVLSFPGDRGDSIQCDHCGASNMEKVLSAHSAPVSFARPKGQTCCGRDERCDSPPCSAGSGCRRG